MSEVLVFVVLLGIMASLIVPQVAGVGAESRTSTLGTELCRMRYRIELYKSHHDGRLPAATGENFPIFLGRMAKKTNAAGDAGIDFGPYILRLPVNPFNHLSTVRIDGAVAGVNIAGWRFDTMTGAFQADDSPEHALF